MSTSIVPRQPRPMTLELGQSWINHICGHHIQVEQAMQVQVSLVGKPSDQGWLLQTLTVVNVKNTVKQCHPVVDDFLQTVAETIIEQNPIHTHLYTHTLTR